MRAAPLFLTDLRRPEVMPTVKSRQWLMPSSEMITHQPGRRGPRFLRDDLIRLFTGSDASDNENPARDAGEHRRK
jgi:hypothetical protein